MGYSKRYFIFTIILGFLFFLNFWYRGQSYDNVEAYHGAQLQADDWNPLIAETVNAGKLTVHIDGLEYTNLVHGIYMDTDMHMMIPTDIIRDAFNCSSYLKNARRLVIEKREKELHFRLDADYYITSSGVQDTEVPNFVEKDGRLYVDMQTLSEELGYSYEWDIAQNTVTVLDMMNDAGTILPHHYDLREKGRAPEIKDQGSYGTCWAFAALTALESSLLPEEPFTLSVDHMDNNNSFTSRTSDGGQYTMAMAYLAAWQGPVHEQDDPYGDGETDVSLQAVLHVQDMEIIESKNLTGIKEAVFKYGGVESCIYTTLQESGVSIYYNSAKRAYCYVGEESPNHDIVIIGWDDDYPKENFTVNPKDNGAFICQNSWGTDFGDNGVFYVSYYDTNIGIHNLVYTGVEGIHNYDRIYQSDLCGWVGQMGYNKESVYGANVFTAKADAKVKAAGFYATDKNTSFKVYIVPEFVDEESLNTRVLVAQGQLENAGYHTIKFANPAAVVKGKKFAVAVWLSTPNAVRPMAIEYAADELTQEVDLTDGEGYVSAQGSSWVDAEDYLHCNLCIKAYVDEEQ